MFSQASVLLTRGTLDVRTNGAMAYEQFFEKLAELGPRATEIDHEMSKTWADVNAAAQAAGIK